MKNIYMVATPCREEVNNRLESNHVSFEIIKDDTIPRYRYGISTELTPDEFRSLMPNGWDEGEILRIKAADAPSYDFTSKAMRKANTCFFIIED